MINSTFKYKVLKVTRKAFWEVKKNSKFLSPTQSPWKMMSKIELFR